MAEFKLTVGEQEYTFKPEMATVGALRQVKQWYGSELGRYNNFIAAFFEGDPDAAVCAVWMARKAAGESNPPEPSQMGDFALTSWINLTSEKDEEEVPTEGEVTSPPTQDSTETPTSSETDISGSSDMSSVSTRKKSKS
jgi:hypothetical protein